MSAPELMKKLLDYVLEQAKTVDPTAFKLSGQPGFQKSKQDLQGLPGVDFDVAGDGDHVWLRVARLEAHQPPALPNDEWKPLIHVSQEPGGSRPSIGEAMFQHRMAAATHAMVIEERDLYVAGARARLEAALALYSPLWSAWSAGETPRRRTISLYGDLFTIKH